MENSSDDAISAWVKFSVWFYNFIKIIFYYFNIFMLRQIKQGAERAFSNEDNIY